MLHNPYMAAAIMQTRSPLLYNHAQTCSSLQPLQSHPFAASMATGALTTRRCTSAQQQAVICAGEHRQQHAAHSAHNNLTCSSRHKPANRALCACAPWQRQTCPHKRCMPHLLAGRLDPALARSG